MTELHEDQDQARPDLERYADVVRRRHIHFLIPLFLGWLIVWGSSWVLPTRYKSSTLILVEQPTMPQNYVAPNVNENLQDRLQSITQQILSRTRLLMIVEKLRLYDSADTKLTQDDLVEHMRKDIGIELVRDSRNQEITAFRINYSAHDPHIAQQVTSELSALFINENLKVREAQSEDTTKFIEKQLEDARALLSEQEAKVRQFQGAHEGALPSQQASNLQILAGLQGQLQNEQDALNTAKQQRVYDQSLLDQYKAAHAGARIPENAPPELIAVEQELARLRGQLTELSSHYTDEYPDVKKLRAQIAKNQKIKEDIIAGMKSGSNESRQGSRALAPGEGATPLQQLQSQLDANQAEISNRERAISGLEARIGEYQGRLNQEPGTEQELAELTRGYDQSKSNYDDLLRKKNQSVMATSMEQMERGERFTILDAPSLPVKPDFPNRLKFCLFGLLGGMALGLGVVIAFEFFDDRIYSEKEIKALVPIAIISEIPEIQSPGDELRAKRRMVFGWATAGIVLVAIMAGSTVSYLFG